jgi:hypothetical protein
MYVFVAVGVLLLAACADESRFEAPQAAGTTVTPDSDGWIALSADTALPAWTMKTSDGWVLVDGILTGGGEGFIWTREEFGDFTLECEYRIGEGGNSGIFFRVEDVADPVQRGLEIQVYDPPPHEGLLKNDPGAVYDLAAPRELAQKPPGEWNRMVLTCDGPYITVELNGVTVVESMNLDDWITPGMNPDGTANKFNRALRDFARTGRIGLQDHGDKVSYRNLRIRRL